MDTDVIITVCKPVLPKYLGFCQSHEHLGVENAHIRAIAPDLAIDDADRTLIDLRRYYQAGGRAVIDAQPIGAGRNAGTLRALSEASGVHVVASTGFHRLLYYPEGHWIFTEGEDRLAALFTEELTTGMYLDGDEGFPSQRGGICAGLVKTALEPGPLSARHRLLFRAATQAAILTGAPLMAHIERGADPLMLAEFLTERGLPPERAVFCHMDRSVADLDVHEAVCARGIALEYDTIARPSYHDNAREIAIIRHMLDAGYGNLLLAGLDVTRARLTGYGGSPGLDYILRVFLSALCAAGVTESQALEIFVENPARVWKRKQQSKE
jgi:phosphotriesterase-related protein